MGDGDSNVLESELGEMSPAEEEERCAKKMKFEIEEKNKVTPRSLVTDRVP